MCVSCVQIYQEVVTDLLSTSPRPLVVRGGVVGGVLLERVGERQVGRVGEARKLLEEAMERRVVGDTKLNKVSSRSHLVIRLTVRMGEKVARLNMVDLAGSKRLKDSEAEGVRRQETAAPCSRWWPWWRACPRGGASCPTVTPS